MRLCIVGGALQGMEAAYLAKKAGYETLVIDRRKNAPALSLADEHAVLDPIISPRDAMKLFANCDAVIPACENMDLLTTLVKMLEFSDIPLLFDIDSYVTSSSKLMSNRLMDDAGVPIPKKWPDCGYPAIVKPSSQSGSIGVSVAHSPEDIDKGIEAIKELGDEPVMQEFVSGKSVSMEVIGNGSSYIPFVTTEIVLSGNYDCKRVKCYPGIINKECEDEFAEISRRIAERIQLNALMDVEAIDTAKGLRVLEIDARIPSQTPAAVLAASGVNILKELVDMRLGKGNDVRAKDCASSYEHFYVDDGNLITCGEKGFAPVKEPYLAQGLFGSDEMLTDYSENAKTWRCTMITRGRTSEDVEVKRMRCIRQIMDECNIQQFIDKSPAVI